MGSGISAEALSEEEIKALESKQEEDKLKGDITNIPPCILTCLYDRLLVNQCAYNNFYCFCSRMSTALIEQKVQSCMKDCPFLSAQIYAKFAIGEFCQVHGADDAELLFPEFLQYGINRRQFSSSALSAPAPTRPTVYTTVTSTLPWGFSSYVITQDVSDGTVTVVDMAQDTAVLTTFFVTTTIPSGAARYTSTFTDQKSAAITEVIAINSGSEAPGPSTSATSTTLSLTSSSTSSPNPSPTNSSGGLSSQAKIGIGVTIPLVFILAATGIFWLLRRRKMNRKAIQQETHDGGLPEPTNTIAGLEKHKDNPPSYHGLHVEAGGAPISEMDPDQAQFRHNMAQPTIHELNAAQQRYEAIGSPVYTGQELSADQARYEASGNPVYVGQELSSQPMTPSPIPASPVSSPSRKPVPVATPAGGQSSASFPLPWDSSGAAEYERELNIGPAEAAAAEDQELKQLEEEVARVKMQKQRLQELQALEAREEELRRSIAERKKLGVAKKS